MASQKRTNKTDVWSGVCCLLGILIGLALIVLSVELSLPTWGVVVMLVGGCLILLVGVILAIALDLKYCEYACGVCGHRFVPTTWAYVCGMHIASRRLLKCPRCGKRNWCRKYFK